MRCYGKTRGPGCWRCHKRDVECSAVEQKQKKQKGKGKGKVEGMADGAECEQDRMMEMMERLTEAVEGIGYRMDMWMRRQEEKEKEKAERGKGKREQGVEKEREEEERDDRE